MKHTISVLVENKFGVLARVAGMFSGRGFNIESLTVGPTLDPLISRMTIVVKGDDRVIGQVDGQLNRLINVIKVEDLTGSQFVDRELVLIKVGVDGRTRPEVMQICDIFRAKIVDVQPETLTVEITGGEEKIAAFIDLMRKFEVLDLTRTGKIAVARGDGGRERRAAATEPVAVS